MQKKKNLKKFCCDQGRSRKQCYKHVIATSQCFDEEGTTLDKLFNWSMDVSECSCLVFRGMYVSFCQKGRWGRNAILSLNVFSHLDYALRLAAEHRSKATCFFLVSETMRCCYSGGDKACFTAGGGRRFWGSVHYTFFSSKSYCNNLTLIFQRLQHEPLEICNRLLLLNQNELSYATGDVCCTFKCSPGSGETEQFYYFNVMFWRPTQVVSL